MYFAFHIFANFNNKPGINLISDEEYNALLKIKSTKSSDDIDFRIIISLFRQYYIEIDENKILDDANVHYNFKLTIHGEYMVKYHESKNR